MMQHSVWLPDEAATLAFGASLAGSLHAPLVIYLNGSLGAGKTTFARGLLKGLGYTGTVKSPTYAIVESYGLPQCTVHHFDLYRFAAPEEWEDAGLGELFAEPALHFIEWPQRAEGFAPAADLRIALQNSGSGRVCTLSADSEKGKQLIELWQNLPAELS